MVRDINQTSCGDYFAIYTNIKSLHCTPETNIMLSVNYSSVKKNKKGKGILQKRRLCLYTNNGNKKRAMSLSAQRRPCLYEKYFTPAFRFVKEIALLIYTDPVWACVQLSSFRVSSLLSVFLLSSSIVFSCKQYFHIFPVFLADISTFFLGFMAGIPIFFRDFQP